MTVITQAFSDAFQLLASGDEETFAAVQATLSTSGLAMLGCIIPGVPLGFLLGYTRFPGRNMLRILVDTDFGRVLIGKRKQVAGVEGFLDARGEAGADAVVAFVFHGHRRIAFGDARGLVGDGGVGFGRSVSGEGGDGGQQQGEAQSQRAEIGVHTSAS